MWIFVSVFSRSASPLADVHVYRGSKTNFVFLFLGCSLYLYLHDHHRMCLVDTRMGVASGEALFLDRAFVCFPSTAAVKFTATRGREVIRNLLFLFVLSYRKW